METIMGLFDELAGAAKGAIFNAAEGGVQAVLGQVVHSTTEGGVEGLLEKLKAGGLGDQVASWMGPGHNIPISADQLQAVLGNQHLQDMARSMGLPVDQALEGLAEHLPGLISGHANG
jgi:uncharacterized protein YidB (DUF937 family)